MLRKDDVLLAVDGCAVANDGTVRFRGWERVAFDHVVSLKTPGEAATLTVRRRKQRIREEGASPSAEEETKEDPEGVGCGSSDSDSELLELVVHVHPRASLVPVHQYDRLPSFYVYAGLVFSPLTQPHLHEFGDDWFNVAPRALVDRALNHHPKRRGEQVVILSQVLADEINAGYQGMHDVEVRRVNGREVRISRRSPRRWRRGGGMRSFAWTSRTTACSSSGGGRRRRRTRGSWRSTGCRCACPRI